MGEENKNVKKPAVSNAVVKKKRREPEQKALAAHVRVTGQKALAVHVRVVAQVLVVRIQIEQAVV